MNSVEEEFGWSGDIKLMSHPGLRYVHPPSMNLTWWCSVGCGLLPANIDTSSPVSIALVIVLVSC